MNKSQLHEHRIIAVAGVDGSGKSTLTDWLRQDLRNRGYDPGFVWSRFNNYLSLAILAATRLSGHNVYREYAGVRMGFHDFDNLPLVLKYMFVGLQAIDVNIATYFKIRRPSRNVAVTICERGPWDTLVDVIADTAMDKLTSQFMINLYCGQIVKQTDIVLVNREAGLIEERRPELVYDTKLRKRQAVYTRLAEIDGWKILDNNGDLAETKRDFSSWLTKMGY